MVAERQAQAVSAVAVTVLSGEERLKDAIQMLRGNADPIVADRYIHPAIPAGGGYVIVLGPLLESTADRALMIRFSRTC